MVIKTPFFNANSSEEAMKRAFEYIKVHKKSLFFSILYFVMPLNALNAIINYTLVFSNLMSNIANPFQSTSPSLVTFFGLSVVGFMSVSMLFSTVFLHIKISSEIGFYEQVTVQMVWDRFRKEALRILVNYFIMFIFDTFVIWVSMVLIFLCFTAIAAVFGSLGLGGLYILGSLFITIFFFICICIISGLVLLNAFMIAYERENAIQLFGKALKMIFSSKKSFWQTFWTVFVSMICLYTIFSIIYIPFVFLPYMGGFLTQYDGIMFFTKYFSIIVASYMFIVPFLFSIGLVLSGFLYFSLEERISHPNLMLEIESIGEKEEKDDLYDFT